MVITFSLLFKNAVISKRWVVNNSIAIGCCSGLDQSVLPSCGMGWDGRDVKGLYSGRNGELRNDR